MRILMTGNAGIHVQRWTEYFMKHGHDVSLIQKQKTFPVGNVIVLPLPEGKGIGNYLKRLISTVHYVRTVQPDIILSHYMTSTETLGCAISNYHPFMVSIWGSDLAVDSRKSRYFRWVTRYVLKHADRIHVWDDHTMMELKALGVPEEKILVQPWGINLEEFDPNQYTRFYMFKNKVVLCANPWEEHRNVEVLIRAIPLVLKEYPNTVFELLAGGPQERYLNQLAHDLGVSKAIRFIGRVKKEEMVKYLNRADMFIDTDVLTRAGGGIGLSIMEAMSMGVPIVLADRPYLYKYGAGLKQEKWFHGLVYQPGDHIALADNILKLIKDANLCKQIGDAEKETMRQLGDWKHMMGNIEKDMKELIRK